MIFRQLLDYDSFTYTYLIGDEASGEALLIDSVKSQVGRDLQIIEELGLTLKMTVDTHVHADHVTAAGELRKLTGCITGGAAVADVACVDQGLNDGDFISIGDLKLEVRSTPGHTSSCISIVLHDEAQPMAFTGDALLIRGSGRTDFQQGCSKTLYASVRNKIFSLPGHTLLYPGHDYKGRTVTSVAEEKAHNPRLGDRVSEAEFCRIMDELNLAYPKHIDVALPANLLCGDEATA